MSQRRPSISSPMHWLSRKDSKVSSERSAALQGAVIVRTPEDALRDTNVRINYQPKSKQQPSQSSQHPSSPPLPPLPVPAEDEAELLEDETPKRPRKPHRQLPRVPSPAPSSSSSPRPSLKSRSSTAVEDPPPDVPPLPLHIPLSAPVPPFSPILVSTPLGQDTGDSSKVIVTLETCTTTFKSTLATLCSRPSFLADYLTSLLKQRTSNTSSVYSSESADVQAYRDHLASQGFLQSASCSTSLHLFLDRPSVPYTHILAFLRTPSISLEYPATLPRGVQLTSFTHSTSSTLFNAKLEALLELRDEAAYIGLDSLHKLCTDEVRQRLSHAQRHARGSSHASINTMISPGMLPSLSGGGLGSIHSHHASVYSLHTLIEHGEADVTVCADKDALDRVSGCSETLDEDGINPLPPLGFAVSPPPPVITPSLKSASTTSLQSLPPPRHTKNPSTASHTPSTTTTITAPPKPIMKPPKPPKPSSSPSHTPPHSANSSPGQTYIRPPYLHKKAESTSVLPLRSPPPLHDGTVPPGSGGGPRRPGLGARTGPLATGLMQHGHGPSPSIGGVPMSPPPGWI